MIRYCSPRRSILYLTTVSVPAAVADGVLRLNGVEEGRREAVYSLDTGSATLV